MQVQQAYYQKLRRKEPFIDLFPQLRQTFFSYAVCCADDRVVEFTIVRGRSIFSQCRIAIFPATPEPYCFAVAEFISPYIPVYGLPLGMIAPPKLLQYIRLSNFRGAVQSRLLLLIFF